MIRKTAFCLLTLLLFGCSTVQDLIQPPVVSLTNIELLEADGFSVRFALDLNIQNPNPVPIPISGLSYALSLNDNQVVTGVLSDGVDLGAYGETEVRLEAGTNLFGMLGLFRDLVSIGQATEFEYELEASIGVSGFNRPIEVSESGVVPLTR